MDLSYHRSLPVFPASSPVPPRSPPSTPATVENSHLHGHQLCTQVPRAPALGVQGGTVLGSGTHTISEAPAPRMGLDPNPCLLSDLRARLESALREHTWGRGALPTSPVIGIL